MKESLKKEIKLEAVVVPADQFLKVKQEFKQRHPKIIIEDEIKTIGFAMLEVPDPVLIGKTKQQQTLVVYWAIYFQEKQ